MDGFHRGSHRAFPVFHRDPIWDSMGMDGFHRDPIRDSLGFMGSIGIP